MFDLHQQNEVVRLFRALDGYYPDTVLHHCTQLFKDHLDQTYFSWMGRFDDDAVYYSRIHSPVAFLEFGFHSGGQFCDSLTLRTYNSDTEIVCLTNETPEKCHIYTINRIPNRGDYGKALVDQYRRGCNQPTFDLGRMNRSKIAHV
jgi:hypothetical protein